MKSGEKRISREDLRRSMFRHKGKMHYSIDGRIIDCRTFEEMRSMKIPDERIIKEFGRSYEDIFREEDEKRKSEENFPDIHNFKELVEYVLTLLPKEIVEKIRLDRNQCKTVTDYIALFPGVYQPILRLRYAYDKRRKGYEAAELESLEKTLSKGMSSGVESAVYNPDAFIEPDSEEDL
jgi:hypothetical protein